MKNKYILIIISAFLLVFTSLNLVSSVPPVTTVSYFPQGYNIEEAQQSFIPYGNNFTYHFMPYNSSNGLPINDINTICTLLIVDDLGNELYVNNSIYKNNFSWSNDINSEVFYKVGEYPYKIDCVDGVGGSLTGTFLIKKITIDDKNLLLDLTDNINIIGLIIFSVIIGLLLYFGMIGLGAVFTIILGFILLFSDINYIISFSVILFGVLIAFSDK